jgi:hypothetical protein
MESAIRTAVAAIYYTGADQSTSPISKSIIDTERLKPCTGEPLQQLIPLEVIPASPKGVLKTFEMRINFTKSNIGNGYLENQWTINEVSYRANISRALLSRAQKGILDSDDKK